MDVTSIILLIGAIVIGIALIWAAVTVLSLIFFRKAQKDMTTPFSKGFDSDFFKSHR